MRLHFSFMFLIPFACHSLLVFLLLFHWIWFMSLIILNFFLKKSELLWFLIFNKFLSVCLEEFQPDILRSVDAHSQDVVSSWFGLVLFFHFEPQISSRGVLQTWAGWVLSMGVERMCCLLPNSPGGQHGLPGATGMPTSLLGRFLGHPSGTHLDQTQPRNRLSRQVPRQHFS